MVHGQFERNGYIVSVGIQVNDLLHFLVHVGKPALLHYTTLIMHTPIQTFLVWSKGNLYQNWYPHFKSSRQHAGTFCTKCFSYVQCRGYIPHSTLVPFQLLPHKVHNRRLFVTFGRVLPCLTTVTTFQRWPKQE